MLRCRPPSLNIVGGNYGLALAVVAGSVAVVIALLSAVGTEAKGVAFSKAQTG
jgi:MFS transporter, SHS family, lactate transporter